MCNSGTSQADVLLLCEGCSNTSAWEEPPMWLHCTISTVKLNGCMWNTLMNKCFTCSSLHIFNQAWEQLPAVNNTAPTYHPYMRNKWTCEELHLQCNSYYSGQMYSSQYTKLFKALMYAWISMREAAFYGTTYFGSRSLSAHWSLCSKTPPFHSRMSKMAWKPTYSLS